MDVGARHCRPRPRCDGCPLEPRCRWRALGPAAPAARVRRQEPFRTSERRWRGAVVRSLAAAPAGLDADELATAVEAEAAGRADGWFAELLLRLEGEGLIARSPDGRVHLPG
jgi:A/G-specific adenine glycosylase